MKALDICCTEIIILWQISAGHYNNSVEYIAMDIIVQSAENWVDIVRV